MSELAKHPKHLARAVVLDGLRNDTPLFVAMQYLGLIEQTDLEDMFADDLAHDVALVPSPDHRRDLPHVVVPRKLVEVPTSHVQISVFRPNPDGTISYHGPRTSEERSAFSKWMEDEIPWSPEVFGWSADDPLSGVADRELNVKTPKKTEEGS